MYRQLFLLRRARFEPAEPSSADPDGEADAEAAEKLESVSEGTSGERALPTLLWCQHYFGASIMHQSSVGTTVVLAGLARLICVL